MAATKRNAMLIDEAREKIRTTQLINRLQNHALGKIEMSQTQVRATEILLRKRIPDLSATEHTGEVTHNHVARIPSPETDIDEWQRKYAPALPNPTRQ